MSQATIGPDIADKIIVDLTALGVDAKRKNPEIRHACDHSIEILKPFTSSGSSSSFKKGATASNLDMLNTVRDHPEFIVPLLMACHSKNVKLIGHAIKILSRIIQLQLLPNSDTTPEGLPEPVDGVVDALMEATNSGSDVQVKILQLLPSFFQLYSLRINGDTLSKMLFICSTLQSANKGPVIINTAQATFSQLIDIAFEKVTTADKASNIEQYPLTFDVPIDNEQTIKVNQFVYDSQRLVSDLCTLIEHHKPSFLMTNYITEDYGFEILESLIKNNAGIFLEHTELSFLLRTRVAPILLRYVSSSKDFSLMVKVSRLIFLLLNDEFDVLRVESEVTLTLLTHILSKDSGAPSWKKTMVLEIYGALFKNDELLKKMFMEYDNNPTEERKRVINDILTVCSNIVEIHKPFLNTGDIIQLPPLSDEPSSTNKKQKQTQQQRKSINPQGLNALEFGKIVRFMDCLEKQEPPQTPDAYNLYLVSQILIALSNCIQTSTLNLMKATDPIVYLSDEIFTNVENQLLKKDYECTCDLISSTWKVQLDITDIFIHSTLDNELFSGTLKLLENLCYCSGILSIQEVKHSVLKYISVCVLKLDGRSGYQSRVMSISETVAGAISSALGQAVSNIANGNESSQSASIVMYPRTLNTRQTLCFHTLIRLGVSLGSHLFDDWKIIFTVLQWVSYYVDGPTGFNTKDVPSISPYLGNRDLQIIEHSLSELNKSIFNQDLETFSYVVNSIISLSDQVTTENLPVGFGLAPLDRAGELQPCIFNKFFYANKLTDVCCINSIKFMVIPDNNLTMVNNYFSKIVDDRSNSDETRLLASRSFNQITKLASEAGFDSESSEIHLMTETKVLTNMCSFMTKLSTLPFSNELLVANCEAEIYLQTLETLKNVIDRFGSIIQKSWDIVTEMLNFPFLIIKNSDSNIMREKIINDMIVSVLKSSFETLKVILDEILQCIPKIQIKVIIDSLHNFVSQKFDLNISFNSVSYFWLISDYIKDKLETLSITSDFQYNVSSETQLLDYVLNDMTDDYQYYQYLWIYLVLQLAKSSPDNRIQVRNGAILTTFSVIQSFSSEATQYAVLYDIILQPVILQIRPPETGLSVQEQKEWMDSFVNIANGISKFLLTLINTLPSYEHSAIIVMFQGITKYFVYLLNMEYNWVELNNQVFKNYHEILKGFAENNKVIPTELQESLFEPWASVKINYNLNNESAYQSSLCSFVDCFPLSMELFKPIMTTSKFEKMLMVLNSSIRYPILVDSRNDNSKCTTLQQAVLDNLSKLNFDKSQTSYPQYESLLIQQLNLIVTLPFHTRDLIVKKLGDKGVKIPTFVAASYFGLQILERHLDNITDLVYLNDRSILKVIKSLLEPSRLKDGVYFANKNEDGSTKNIYLWMISFEILVKTTVKMLDFVMKVPDGEFKSTVNSESLAQLIPLSLSVFDCCFIPSTSTVKSKDAFDLSQYQIIKGTLLNLFNAYYETGRPCTIQKTQVEQFISSIWRASFYYENDPILGSIFPDASESLSGDSMDVLTGMLLDENIWDIYGTTTAITISPRLKIARQCFTDLITLVDPSLYPHLWEITFPFFLSRCTVGLRKYIMDIKLLGNKPVSRILIVELQDILNGIQRVLSFSNNNGNKKITQGARKVFMLLVNLLAKVNNKNIESTLTSICLALQKN